MTRRLPEGPWDPTKIPRIQILMSQDVLLVGVGGVSFPLVETLIGPTRSVRKIQLDELHRSHNPKVGGSNPPPATIIRRFGPIREVRPFCCLGIYPPNRQTTSRGVPFRQRALEDAGTFSPSRTRRAA